MFGSFQVMALLTVLGIAGSVGGVFYGKSTGYEQGQHECRAEVASAVMDHLANRADFIAASAQKAQKSAIRTANAEGRINDAYDLTLDAIRIYGAQLDACQIPADVRAAESAISEAGKRR